MGLELYGQAVFVVRYEGKGERGLLGEGGGGDPELVVLLSRL